MFRRFLGPVVAALAVAFTGCEIEDVARLVDDVRTDARLGVIARLEDFEKGNVRALEKVLRYYRQESVDAVVVAGGVTRDQTVILRQAWALAFGGAAGPRLILEDGRQEVNGFAFVVAKMPPASPCDVLTFHGGRGGALTDELVFFDPDTGAVAAGSLSAITVPAGFSRNGRAANGGDKVGCLQGLLVSVYSDTVRIRRLDFSQQAPVAGGFAPQGIYAEDVAPELALPRKGPYAHGTEAAPEFWPDTVIRAMPGFSGSGPICTVTWPAVQRRFTGVRAFCYEVGLHRMRPGADKPSRAVRSRTVLSEAYHLSELRDTKPVSCVFTQKDLVAAGKGDPVVVSVTPIGSLGDRGKTRYTEPFARRVAFEIQGHSSYPH